MMKDAAKVIVSLFERRGAIRPDEREVYIYCCDIVLYTLISTLGLLARHKQKLIKRSRLVTLAQFSIFYLQGCCRAAVWLRSSDRPLRCVLSPSWRQNAFNT